MGELILFAAIYISYITLYVVFAVHMSKTINNWALYIISIVVVAITVVSLMLYSTMLFIPELIIEVAKWQLQH